MIFVYHPRTWQHTSRRNLIASTDRRGKLNLHLILRYTLSKCFFSEVFLLWTHTLLLLLQARYCGPEFRQLRDTRDKTFHILLFRTGCNSSFQKWIMHRWALSWAISCSGQQYRFLHFYIGTSYNTILGHLTKDCCSLLHCMICWRICNNHSTIHPNDKSKKRL